MLVRRYGRSVDTAYALPEGASGSGIFSSIGSFSCYVMGSESDPSRLADNSRDDLSDAWSIAPKRRGVYNLVQVPTRLERLIFLNICVCADEFLFLFTLLPIRCLAALLELLRRVAAAGIDLAIPTRHSRGRESIAAYRSLQSIRVRNVIDLMHLTILVLTSVALSCLDISFVYHSIRGQSVIKLYVVFNVLEIFDRLCCSFGVDVLDSLGWTAANAINYWNRIGASRRHAQNGEGAAYVPGFATSSPLRGFVLLTRVMVDYMLTLVYVCLHASLLLIWVVTLNVAINTQNNALLTLLVSNNFVELKGAVFKNFRVQNLFQIACSDAVERFQLTVFLGVMMIYAEGDRRLLVTWGIMFLCEVVVDWVKHAFVTKFNRIPHRAYRQYAMVICSDIVQARKNAAVRSIGGSSVAKRIGFVSIPLGALVVRMVGGAVCRMPGVSIMLTFAIMLVTKMTLAIGLLGHAARRVRRRLHRTENDADRGRAEDGDDWYKSLMNVERYDKS